MEAKNLLIDTLVAQGKVGLGEGGRVLAQTQLDIKHRHNRDLVPAVAKLLQTAGWRPCDVTGVIVSCGPGSYTGLRVGVMSAKSFAYAVGCPLIPVETFRCLARQAPRDIDMLDVIADAQQGQVYVQGFERQAHAAKWQPAEDLKIEPLTAWLARRQPRTWASGPAVVTHAKYLGGQKNLVSPKDCVTALESLLLEAKDSGLARVGKELLAFEPLYLRPSSAEEKWAKLGR